jgi:hypothetical protein
MKIDGDFGADDLKNETRYVPNINTIWETLRYFYSFHAKLTCLTKKVIFTLKPSRGAQADSCGIGGDLKTGVNKNPSASWKRLSKYVLPLTRLMCYL